eukprot:TRINITY_DN7165_c0_g1_i1.p1 TRINITY_DN7165_c0_g1~~TRINITY_DN7165_c0_g1_i1.p1  ORF type:complete len:647 (-),score=174.65 TRINITY_DN7165_c0_g1_i1:698-2356(-)
MQLDMIARLKEMKANPSQFASDYDFHQQLVGLVRQLHDGHTGYSAPSCYSNFRPLQPLMLISYASETGGLYPDIGVAAIYPGLSPYYKSIGIDVAQLIGGTVLSINGVDAWQYIMMFANSSVGTSKDVQVRYNIALTQFRNGASYTLGSFESRTSCPKPKAGEKVQYDVRLTDGSIVTVELPWVALVAQSVTNVQSFTKWCYSAPTTEEKWARSQQSKQQLLAEPRVELAHTAIKPTTSDPAFEIVPLLVSDDVSFYSVNKNTAVVVVPSFEPISYLEFGKNLEAGLTLLANNSLHRLIVDVTNNGGGDLCLGYTLIKLLFSEFSPYGANDLISSPLAVDLANAAVETGVDDTYWSPQKWIDVTTNKTFPAGSTSWLVPGIQHVRGGVLGNYSNLFRDGCDIYFDVMPNPVNVHYRPSQVRVLSNGFCGSTCAVFSRHLQEFDGVKTVAVGGVQQMTMGISTTPGGQVIDVAEAVSMIEELGQASNPLSPQDFITTATMRFTLREIYPWNRDDTEVPIEYFYEPATYHIPYTKDSAINSQLVWKDVVKTFIN